MKNQEKEKSEHAHIQTVMARLISGAELTVVTNGGYIKEDTLDKWKDPLNSLPVNHHLVNHLIASEIVQCTSGNGETHERHYESCIYLKKKNRKWRIGCLDRSNIPFPNGERQLLIPKQKLWEMAKVITEKQKAVLIMGEQKPDWNQLEELWFEWLEENLFENSEK